MIVWLSSYPKSGNTWLRSFLANYYLDRPVNPNHLTPLGFCGDLRPIDYERAANKPAADIMPDEVPLLRLRVHAMLSAWYDPLAFVKTHNFLGMEGSWPTVSRAVTQCAVYVVRDPRDVAVSLARHLDTSIDEAIALMGSPMGGLSHQECAIYHRLSTWSVHVESWMFSDVTKCVVKYEELLRDPVGTFGDIVRFLGSEFDRGRIKRALKGSSLKALRAIEKREGFAEQSDKGGEFFFKGGSRWKQILTKEQAQTVVGDHRDVMTRLGYLLN